MLNRLATMGLSPNGMTPVHLLRSMTTAAVKLLGVAGAASAELLGDLVVA